MNDPVENSMVLLRQDAVDRGLQEAAIAYGWSAIRLRGLRIDRLTAEINSSVLKCIPLIYDLPSHRY